MIREATGVRKNRLKNSIKKKNKEIMKNKKPTPDVRIQENVSVQ